MDLFVRLLLFISVVIEARLAIAVDPGLDTFRLSRVTDLQRDKLSLGISRSNSAVAGSRKLQQDSCPYSTEAEYASNCGAFAINAIALDSAGCETSCAQWTDQPSSCCSYLDQYDNDCLSYYLENEGKSFVPLFDACDRTPSSYQLCVVDVPDDTYCDVIQYPIADAATSAEFETAQYEALTLLDLLSEAPLKSVSSPTCIDALERTVCGRRLDKMSTLSVWEEDVQLSFPLCRSVCEEVMNECEDLLDYLMDDMDTLNMVLQLIVPPNSSFSGYEAYGDFEAICEDHYTALDEEPASCFDSFYGDDKLLGATFVSVAMDLYEDPALEPTSDMIEMMATMLDVDPNAVIMHPQGMQTSLLTFVVLETDTNAVSGASVLSALGSATSTEIRSFITAVIDSGYQVTSDKFNTLSADVIFASDLPSVEQEVLDGIYTLCNGEDWDNVHGWSERDYCAREGVVCDFHCDSHVCDNWYVLPSRVLEVNLPNRNIVCEEIPYLHDLTSLRALDLGGNSLTKFSTTDTFPHTLQELSLYEAGLSGSTPSYMSHLNDLTHLNFGTKPRPPDVWGHYLSSSVIPDNANSLSGEMDWLTSLVDLEYLNLDYNNLDQEFPTTICDKTDLQHLSLVGTGIYGSLPSCVADSDRLEELFLENNNFEGTIPGSLGTLPSLRQLSLFNNAFSGTLPESTFCELEPLVDIGIFQNQFSGGLPDCIDGLASLEVLLAHEAALSGTVPAGLGSLYNLKALMLQFNNFEGELPECEMSNMFSLSLLNLQGNQLEGDFPLFLRGQMSSATAWVFADNLFSGTLPASSKLGCTSDECFPTLRILRFGNNEFTGSIPSDWSYFTNLSVLSLQNNGLTSLPSSLWCNFAVEDLDLSSNKLSGTLPECLSEQANLRQIDLSFNQFSGSMPPAWGDLSDLASMVVASNQIEGCIPVAFKGLTSLNVLDLSGNRLSCNINAALQAIRDLPHLSVLDLSSNEFFGTVGSSTFPIELVNAFPLLSQIALSNNAIEGTLVTSLASLPALHSLMARNTSISGEIDDAFSSLRLLLVGNNTGMVSPDGTLPSFVTTAGGYELDDSLAFSCPQLEGSSDGIIDIDPHYYNFTLCKCEPGYYGTPSVSCEECDNDGVCEGGMDAIMIKRKAEAVMEDGSLNECDRMHTCLTSRQAVTSVIKINQYIFDAVGARENTERILVEYRYLVDANSGWQLAEQAADGPAYNIELTHTRVGVFLVEARIDGDQLDASPFYVEVLERTDCASGFKPNSVGQCVEKGNDDNDDVEYTIFAVCLTLVVVAILATALRKNTRLSHDMLQKLLPSLSVSVCAMITETTTLVLCVAVRTEMNNNEDLENYRTTFSLFVVLAFLAGVFPILLRGVCLVKTLQGQMGVPPPGRPKGNPLREKMVEINLRLFTIYFGFLAIILEDLPLITMMGYYIHVKHQDDTIFVAALVFLTAELGFRAGRLESVFELWGQLAATEAQIVAAKKAEKQNSSVRKAWNLHGPPGGGGGGGDGGGGKAPAGDAGGGPATTPGKGTMSGSKPFSNGNVGANEANPNASDNGGSPVSTGAGSPMRKNSKGKELLRRTSDVLKRDGRKILTSGSALWRDSPVSPMASNEWESEKESRTPSRGVSSAGRNPMLSDKISLTPREDPDVVGPLHTQHGGHGEGDVSGSTASLSSSGGEGGRDSRRHLGRSNGSNMSMSNISTGSGRFPDSASVPMDAGWTPESRDVNPTPQPAALRIDSPRGSAGRLLGDQPPSASSSPAGRPPHDPSLGKAGNGGGDSYNYVALHSQGSSSPSHVSTRTDLTKLASELGSRRSDTGSLSGTLPESQFEGQLSRVPVAEGGGDNGQDSGFVVLI
eukprot:Rmarinus@m.27944